MFSYGPIFPALFLMLTASSAPAWTAPINLTRLGEGADAGSAVLATDAAGRLHVFVGRSGQTIHHLVVDAQVRTAFGPFASGVSPSAAGDSNGKIHTVWGEGWEIRYKEWNGGWGPNLLTLSDGSGDSNKPHVYVDPADNVHVVWSKGGQVWYNRRSGTTGTWDGPAAVPGADDLEGYFGPRVSAVGSQPVILFGKHNGGNWNAWFASREGGPWTTYRLDSLAGCSNGDIDVDPAGNIFTAWDRNYDIWGNRRSNGVWGNLISIRVAPGNALAARVSSVSPTKTDIVWVEGSPADLWGSRWNGTTWSSPASVAGGNGGPNCDIAHDPAGHQHVIWSRDWDIWWVSDQPLDTTPPPAPAGLIAAAGALRVNLNWTNPNAFDLFRVRIIHRSDRLPISVTDGAEILNRAAAWGPDSFSHTGPANGIVQYYAVFLTDSSGNVSPAANASAMPIARQDFDKDGDVDMNDFGHLQVCLSGAAVPQHDAGCQDAKLDGDGDVDQADIGVFTPCMNGAAALPAPACPE